MLKTGLGNSGTEMMWVRIYCIFIYNVALSVEELVCSDMMVGRAWGSVKNIPC